jgi:hypothetical protein
MAGNGRFCIGKKIINKKALLFSKPGRQTFFLTQPYNFEVLLV